MSRLRAAAIPVSLALLAGVAFVIRFRLMRSLPLNYDEHWHLFAASVPPWPEFLGELRGAAHPPLYLLLLRAWTWLIPSSSLARLPSVLAGCACIPLVYWCARRMGLRPAVAWLAALVFAVSPAHVAMSISIRGYSLATVWTLAAFGSLCGALAAPPRSVRALPIFCVLAMWTSYSALLAVVAMLSLPALAALVRRDRDFTARLRALGARLAVVVLPATLALGAYLGWSVRLQTYSHITAFLPADHRYGSFFLHAAARDLADLLSLPLAEPALVSLVIVGAALLLWSTGRALRRGGDLARALAGGAALGVCLLLFVLAILRLYPFGGLTRHQFVLFPFLVLSPLVAVDRLAHRLLLVVPLIGIVAWGVLGLRRPLPEDFSAPAPCNAELPRAVGATPVYLMPFSAYALFGVLPGARWSASERCGARCLRYQVTPDADHRLNVLVDSATWEVPELPDELFLTRLTAVMREACFDRIWIYRQDARSPDRAAVALAYQRGGFHLESVLVLAGGTFLEVSRPAQPCVPGKSGG